MRLLHVAGNCADFRTLAVWKAIDELGDGTAQDLLTERGAEEEERVDEVRSALGLLPIEPRVIAPRPASMVEPLASTMAEVDRALAVDPPGAIVVYGASETAVAASISGTSRGIPVAHYPGGARVGSFHRSAEANRIAIDQYSCLHLCETPVASETVRGERIPTRGAPVVGFLNGDFLDMIPGHVLAEPALPELASARGEYLAVVLDHPRTMDSAARVDAILAGLKSVATRMRVALLVTEGLLSWVTGRLGSLAADGLLPVGPCRPMTACRLLAGARGVITDMYWAMEMACHLGRPCIGVESGDRLPQTVHPDDLLMIGGRPGDLERLTGRMHDGRFTGPGERSLAVPPGAASRAAAALCSDEWLDAGAAGGAGIEL